MGDSLSKVEKNLKALAKRYESVRYSKGLAILFLMLGVNAFSEENVEDHNQNQNTTDTDGNKNENSSESINKVQIKSTATKLKERLEQIKKENEKNFSNEKLELIKLMEQGDQVVKSPWSSWQFGANTFQDFSVGKYKGHGDKVQNEVLTRGEATIKDSNGKPDPLARFVKGGTTLSKTSYNNTDLNYIDEPNAEFTLSAKIGVKTIEKKIPTNTPKVEEPKLSAFISKVVVPPSEPSSINVVPPTLTDPPNINFKGKGFYQSSVVGRQPDNLTYDGIIIQNYDSYEVVNEKDGTEGILNIEVGNFGNNVKARWWGSDKNGKNTDVKLKVKTEETRTDRNPSGDRGTIYFSDGEYKKSLYTFISDIIDHDPNSDIKISGKYVFTNKGNENESSNRMFLSHNPAGVGSTEYSYKGIGNLQNQAGERVTTFVGDLTIHGASTVFTGSTASSNVTIGVEDQLWGRGVRKDAIPVFKNSGTIKLESGYNMVGILIDIERDTENAANKITDTRSANTYNEGKIIINGGNSIGIDYGEYLDRIFKSNLKLGNIIVGGEKNYGLRMSNIFKGNKKYFDYGVTISSGGENKKILVQGKQNVGVSIAKFLSETYTGYKAANIKNPIENISNLNIEVDGEEGVGFLRHKSYENNTQDMIFNADIMGKFSFGDNAKKSTLIRTDKYGIDLQKDITTNGGESGNSFAQVVSPAGATVDSVFKNNANLTANNAKEFTGIVATGANAKVFNNKKVEINGDGNKNMGITLLENSTLTNTGEIKISGSGKERVGIYNEGTVDLQAGSKLEVSGEKSAAIYNKSTFNITGATEIKATDGAMGVFSENGFVVSTARNTLKISTEGKGLGAYAKAGASVDLAEAEIDVQGGEAGVASYGASSVLDLAGGKLKYSGNGYALFSDGNGEINLRNSSVELRGNATLTELDYNLITTTAPTSRKIKFNNTDVKVYSNDVTGINVKNLGTKNISDLLNIENQLGVNIVAGTENGTTFDKFKSLVIDDATINFDVETDKTENSNTAGGYFFKKVLGQRLKLNVNKNLSAKLTSAQADEFYDGQVVGVKNTSSPLATTNTEAKITVASGVNVEAARLDGTDKGAVGLFNNYGTIENNGNVLVEKDSLSNSNAVGIYAVNGTAVENKGTVDVGGKNSVGILGMSYRTNLDGSIATDEFGVTAADQGKINIKNTGNIKLDGEKATGIFAKNNGNKNLSDSVALNDTTGTITLTGNKAVGMAGEKATVTNKGTININGKEATGLYGKNSSVITNEGEVNLVDGTSADKPNIGIFSEDDSEIINSKNITGGSNTYGIYGKNIKVLANGKIKVGENSVGAYSDKEFTTQSTIANIDLAANSLIEIGANNSAGIFTTGKNQYIKNLGDMKIGAGSYGYVLKGERTKVEAFGANETELKGDSVFIFSDDKIANVTNKTPLKSVGDKNYAAYVRGNFTNLADINFLNGVGNIGIYHTRDIGDTTTAAVNGSTSIRPTITVGKSDAENEFYSIGMVAGRTQEYKDEATGKMKYKVISTGKIENYGKINVTEENGIGMYATGDGSLAINHQGAEINLGAKNAIGIYLTDGAIGENYGTIQTVASAKGMKGVLVANGAIFKNYGTFKIDGKGNSAISVIKKGKVEGNLTATDIIVTNGAKIKGGAGSGDSDSSKEVKGIKIEAKPDQPVKITRDGVIVKPVFVDTTVASPKAPDVQVGDMKVNLKVAEFADIKNISKASSIGMYIDTSGVNYTKPIEGLNNLENLEEVNLILGTEATRYTGAKDIEVGENILKPFNDALEDISSSGGEIKFYMKSSSLTWIGTAKQGDDGMERIYLSKIPYTSYAKDKNTFNFMNGLEQRYGVEKSGREKTLFNKLNDIGKGEPALLAQAVDEMMGHQYANTQQRIKETSDILDKEFNYLRKDWQNFSKDSNKIKTFGTRGKYETNTAGVIDYTNNAYGVAYVHEDETLNLGKTSGWYAGIVDNKFNFKDIGSSKEEQLQGKIGVFKSIPFDYDNSLNLTISGDLSVGYNKMNRRFLVVDEIFGAKAKYYTYAAGLKNELSKEIRLSEDFSFKPYAQARVEYGKISKIREKSGEMKLEVKANDYYSIKPEAGAELIFKYSFGSYKTVKAVLSAAYENELGKIADGRNQAKVADTSADYFNIRGEKENREGNIKTDFKIGVDNSRVGLTANVGYDTKGQNIRGGVGVRFIF